MMSQSGKLANEATHKYSSLDRVVKVLASMILNWLLSKYLWSR